MDTHQAEKRKFIRFDMETKINLFIQEKGHGVTHKIPAVNKNVCLEGVCFLSNQRLEQGTIVKLEIFLPSQPDPLRLEGEVRWSRFSEKKDGKDLFETGVKLFITEKTDEGKFIGYVSTKKGK